MHPLPGRRSRNYFYRMTLRGLRLGIRQFVRGVRRFIIHRVLHADDPPHRLALGVAIGIFVTFTPTIGLQTAIVVLLAWLLGANKIVGVPLVWITNPATIVPIYYPCYVIGRILLDEPEIELEWWQALRTPPPGWLAGLKFYWDRMLEIAVPLWLGCLVVGAIFGLISYYVTYFAVRWYRLKRWGQLLPPRAKARRRSVEPQ